MAKAAVTGETKAVDPAKAVTGAVGEKAGSATGAVSGADALKTAPMAAPGDVTGAIND